MRNLALEVYRVAGAVMGWVLWLLFTLAWGALVLPLTLLLGQVWPSAYELYAQLTHGALRLFVQTLSFARIRIEGGDHRLAGARVLVANHQSRLDSPVMLAVEPRLFGPVRGYMLRVPIIGRAIRMLGFFDADADFDTVEAMNRAAERARSCGAGLLFYPEGTRSEPGEVGHFHRGAFRAAFDHDLPIQPVVIEGLDQAFPRGCVISPVRGRHLVRIRYLEPLYPPYGTGPRRDVVRALAERVRKTLVDELAKLRAERET